MILFTICWIIILTFVSWLVVGKVNSKNTNNPKFTDEDSLEGNNKNNDNWDDNKGNTEG